MLTYTELAQSFRDNLNTALETYQQRYTDRGKRIPRRRAQDIADLIALIDDNHLDALELKESCTARIQQIQTGWWIFRTGRSCLKKNMQRVLHEKAYRESEFLLALINELEQASQKLPDTREEATEVIREDETKEAITDERIITLETENKRLAEDKQSLLALVERLRKANHRFTDEYLTKVRQRREAGEQAYSSPSESLYDSLTDEGAWTEDLSATESDSADETDSSIMRITGGKRYGFF